MANTKDLLGTSGILNDAFLNYLTELRAQKKSVVFVSGNFNILHPGHVRLLALAADCGDILVVGVNPDSTAGVMFDQDMRMQSVRALQLVDFVVKLEGLPVETIRRLKPDIVVKGKEHEKKSNPESEPIKSYGGKLLFASGETKYSSMDLLEKDYERQGSIIIRPNEYLERRQITVENQRRILAKMRDLKVAVIGDIIVDEYITCDALGMSMEDPTIVVAPVHRKKFVGGAGIVASHARGLGAHTLFFTVTGADDNAKYVAEELKKNGVETYLFEDQTRPTTLKQRFRTKEKTLLRVSELRQHAISAELVEEICKSIFEKLRDVKLVIFSDFNYGCLPQILVDRICQFCAQNNILTVADSQSSSQIGDISRFKNMLLVTPTEREARLGVNDFESGLVVLADKLRRKSNAKHVLLTLGGEGLLIHTPDVENENVDGENVTDQLPALNASPKDTAGAGDSLLVTTSLALATGADIWTSSYLGCVAAACQVSRIGNIPLKVGDVLGELS